MTFYLTINFHADFFHIQTKGSHKNLGFLITPNFTLANVGTAHSKTVIKLKPCSYFKLPTYNLASKFAAPSEKMPLVKSSSTT